MLKYTRNKWVSIWREAPDTLTAHGVLDDDIYGLELDVSIRISSLEILSIKGKWNRWTTPDCPRAIPFLQEAVGFRIDEEGFSQKVHKSIGRRACRHYANLLLECCHSSRDAVLVFKWEDEKERGQELSFEEFINNELKGKSRDIRQPVKTPEGTASDRSAPEEDIVRLTRKEGLSGGMTIDLHVHTSPASPCSSAPVDDLIKEAKRIGLDGICLTDHNYVWDPGVVEDLRQKHNFLVLRGNEITTDQGDIVVFGLDRDIKGIIRLEELRGEVLNAGGFMIVAHPFRGFLTFGVSQLGLTPERAMERPLLRLVDAVEVLNGKVTDKENDFALQVATGLGMPVTGGSDAHEVNEVGLYATHFESIVRNEEDLVTGLKNGSYSPVTFRKEWGTG